MADFPEIVSATIIKTWNPNENGGAHFFPETPEVGKTIQIEKYSDDHYRWVEGYVDTRVPLDCVKIMF